MINEYDKRDEVEAMTDEQRAALPRITNNNGGDYASCPECKHYHAMMPHNTRGGFNFNYCRDCGAIAVVVEKRFPENDCIWDQYGDPVRVGDDVTKCGTSGRVVAVNPDDSDCWVRVNVADGDGLVDLCWESFEIVRVPDKPKASPELREIEELQESLKTLKRLRVQVADFDAIWRKLDHAANYLQERLQIPVNKLFSEPETEGGLEEACCLLWPDCSCDELEIYTSLDLDGLYRATLADYDGAPDAVGPTSFNGYGATRDEAIDSLKEQIEDYEIDTSTYVKIPNCEHCGHAGQINEQGFAVAWCGGASCPEPNEVEV